MSENIKKIRLDQILVNNNLSETKEKAQRLILSGNVLINETVVDKCGVKYPEDSNIRIKSTLSKYVSRGGDKLESAISHFKINPKSLVAADIGSSTGGFTDCLLQFGASHVYALDVGTNQLDYKLRNDTRITVMEKTHIKLVTKATFEKPISLATIDLSFISVRKVIKYIVDILENKAKIICLVKPQFELERSFIEKGGVVRSLENQILATALVSNYCKSIGLTCSEPFKCPITGSKKGNQEYFVIIEKP